MAKRGFSKDTYERLNDLMNRYIENMSARLIETFGLTPPFVEPKPETERYLDYLNMARNGTLQSLLTPGIEHSEDDVIMVKKDIERLMAKYGPIEGYNG